MANNYYPALSTVITGDQFPDNLSFVADSLDDLLDQVYFKDLKLEKSHDGSTYSCALDIVSTSGILGLTIPGTGLILQLNPDPTDPEDNITIIPILLSFKWGILKLLKEFSISNFSFQADAFNQLILQVTQINDTTLLSGAIDGFINSTDPVSQFISDAAFNAAGYSAVIPFVGGATNDWKGTLTADWGTAGNWSAGHSPLATETARIGIVAYAVPGNQPVLNASVSISTLSFGALAPGGKPVLTINSGKILSATNGLTIAPNTAVTINGPGGLTLSSNSQLLASTESLTAALNLVITLTGGSFITNTSSGSFKLASDANGSASIALIPTTSGVNGTVEVDRYLTGGSSADRGYRYLSSPVYAGTVSPNNVYSINYLQANAYITGATGGTGFNSFGNPTLYFYREDRAVCNATFTCGNFSGVSNVGTSPLNYSYTMDPESSNFNLPVGDGYLFFFRGEYPETINPTNTSATPVQDTLRETGTLNQGQITVHDWYNPTTLTNTVVNTNSPPYTPNTSVRGETLVGNPYPSTIDLSTFQTTSTTTGIYGSNVSSTFIELNNNNGSYQDYSSVTGPTGTASQYIQSGAGFYITATANNATFIFNETAKSPTHFPPSGYGVFMDARLPDPINKQYLRLELNADTIHYEDILLWYDGVSKMAFEPEADGPYKLGYDLVSLSSLSSDGVELAINRQPLLANDRRATALNVDALQNGTYHFVLRQNVNIPAAYDVVLVDHFKKDSVILHQGSEYDFAINKADTATFGYKRFSLVVEPSSVNAYKLLDFSAYKLQATTPQVQVNWKTQNEGNSTVFTVERSTDDGKSYMAIGFARAANQGKYNFIDKNPLEGINLYRLKQEDQNLVSSYSKVVQIDFSGKDNLQNNIVIYPNPAVGNVCLSIVNNTSVSAAYHVKFTNSSGTTIKEFSLSSDTWNGSLDNLLPGNYIVWVTDNKTNSYIGQAKFIKL